MDIALINAVPFLLAILMIPQTIRRVIPLRARAWVMAGVMAILFAALIGYFPFVQEAAADKGAVERIIEWVPELGLSLNFYLDGLSLLFGLVITGIGTGVFLYAGYYFDDEAEQARFLWQLAAFAGAMLGVVLAGNLITLFVMWELTSITSFLLIGFKGAKSESARFGAMQAFWVTGAGALALIVGIVILGALSGQLLNAESGFTFELSSILQLDPAAVGAHPLYAAVAILIMIGAFTKSAQFPFHFWLPGAMEAPTPASSYLHSATMVKAGIYLLARLYPPLHDNMLWTAGLVTIGMITMLLGAFFAISQRDLKGLLAYSTVSKLGAIVALIGLPGYEGLKAAFVGILAHALYKAALFLVVGTVDHNTGTRIIDKLGGLRRYMPGMAIITIISGLSMAGLFPFFGFVAKEVLIDAFVHLDEGWANLALAVTVLSATFTVIAALIVIWDVFFKEPQEEIHFHAGPLPLSFGPGAMALGSTLLGFFIPTLIVPLLQTAVPKEFSLYLLPPEFWNVTAFQLSTGALIVGGLLFLARRFWLPFLMAIRLPRGTEIYRGISTLIDKTGDVALLLQNGQVRYYLVVILGVVALVILGSGQLADLIRGRSLAAVTFTFNTVEILRGLLLILAIAAALYSVFVRQHLTAAIAVGVIGYSVGGIFMLEPAPDVALVQLLVETLATVLLIVMLGRISAKQRGEVMAKLWKGRSMVGKYNVGILRDIAIASIVGTAVFLFALTAVLNRPAQGTISPEQFCDLSTRIDNGGEPVRDSISRYHLCNTYEDLGITDVVGAIVSDYRGMDTFIEIGVFAAASLGVLTLLSRGLSARNPLIPQDAYTQGEFEESVLEEIQDTTRLKTPFTQVVARLVMPLIFLVAVSHIIYGSSGPGDGFTAGALIGLVTSLWYVVFGYSEASSRLNAFSPHRLLRAGLLLAVANAILPILMGDTFMGYIAYDKLLGIDGILSNFGLKLTTTLVFEISVALTVFGGFGAITEAIGHPKESESFDDPAADTNGNDAA